MCSLSSAAFAPSSHCGLSAISPFFGRPITVPDDGHRVGKLDHRLDPIYREGGLVIDRLERAAEHGAVGDGADQHAGHAHVDPVCCAPVDLRRRVQASASVCQSASSRCAA